MIWNGKGCFLPDAESSLLHEVHERVSYFPMVLGIVVAAYSSLARNLLSSSFDTHLCTRAPHPKPQLCDQDSVSTPPSLSRDALAMIRLELRRTKDRVYRLSESLWYR